VHQQIDKHHFGPINKLFDTAINVKFVYEETNDPTSPQPQPLPTQFLYYSQSYIFLIRDLQPPSLSYRKEEKKTHVDKSKQVIIIL
jgi:hypothetical protein